MRSKRSNPTPDHRNEFQTHQLLKHTGVEGLFLLPALPEIHVLVLEALPVSAELSQALPVDVGNPTVTP